MNQIRSSYKLLCIIFVLFNCSKAFSLNLKSGDSCASSCSGKEKIFKYEEDKIYVYNFLSKHTIKNPNAEKETLQLELRGKAEVSKISACDYGLQLTDINLKESLLGKDGMIKDYAMMKTLLEKNSLRFGFDDGRIVGVCQDKMDNEFAVNVKKAIISSLQVSLDSLDAPNYLTETDISGDCITEYSTASEPPNFVIVKKTKSISGCARKNKYFSSLSGRQFEEPMENRHLALLDGLYECTIKIKRSEGLKESICKETQMLKPFSSEKTGSSIEIRQELTFDSIKNGKLSTQTPNTRSDLTMNHGDQAPLFMTVKKTPALKIAEQLCIALQKNIVSTEKTQLFVKFIRSLSDIDYKSIQEVDKYFTENAVCAPNKSKLKNILLDALPYTKTEDAFKYLLEDANLHKFQNLGFTFLENASPNIIRLFTKKLDDPNTGNSVLMTLSSMIKSFCDKTSGCILNPDIINAMNRLVKDLENNCISKDKALIEKGLFTLRALGNAGNFPDYNKLIKILESCVSSKVNENEMKIFAVESLRQFPCQANIDNFLWNIYDDISYITEVRIQAYLSLIRCPFRETFRKIIQKLNNENSQQLGSYVWSHISNLMETSDRFKTELRDMLQIFTKPMNDLARKFNLDFRSYSKNIEKTFQRGYSAAKIDSNILFSSSPVPSSVTANITIDVFGRSINILEFGIRGKGISEKIFGNISPKPHKNVHSDIIKMHRKNENKAEKLNVAMYSRIMGREIYFNPNILSDVTMSLLNPDWKYSFEKSFLLFDVTISVSSITGFPVQLTIESAISAELQSNSKMMLSDIDISTKNNVAIQMIGKLQINAHCTKIGVQSFGKVSSDTEFGGKLKLISKQTYGTTLTDYQFEINKMPDDKKLLSISNELTLIHNLESDESKPQYSVLLNKCTGNAILELRGIKICAEVSSAPNYESYFPNLKAELNINKFNGFRFKFFKENILKPVNKMINLILSTSFQGGEKDTFKIQFQRNIKEVTSMYEISLWNKDVYAKLNIVKNQVSGQLKYGQNEATMSGSIDTKGISSTVNLNIKTINDEMDLTFKQKFENGLLLSLTASKKNDKEFSLSSSTSMVLTKHKVFNYFERFRHSTILKLSGDNKFELTVSRDKGNNPMKENKAIFETYWKTKSKNNFLIKQEYLWSKYSVVDNSISSVPGVNYTIFLSQKLEVGEKRFDMQHNINYFMSKSFSVFENKPSLMIFKLETFDNIKNKFIRQLNTKVFFDVMNASNGTVVLQNYINHPSWKIYQMLNAKAMWKRNSLDMYDIEAEITESDLLKLLFKHKFTTTQNGVSSIELISRNSIFKINSELSLPKSHVLTISWPKNSLIIDSKVDTKSIRPFSSVISHDIKLNNNILATITNSAEYDYDNRLFSYNSIGKTREKQLYSVKLGGYLKHELTLNKVFYDFASQLEMKIPGNEVDFNIETKQFANFLIDGKIIMNGKTVESKLVYSNKNKELYGYEIVAEGIKSTESYYQYKTTLFKGLSTDKYIFKYGKMERKCLFGLSIDSSKFANFELLWKSSYGNEKIYSSVLASLDLKLNDNYNFFYKNNITIAYKVKNSYSLTWNGEYGKTSNSKLIPFQGFLKYFGTGFNKFDINFDIGHPLLSKIKLEKVIFGFNFNLESIKSKKGTVNSNVLVKWQFEKENTFKYYELKLNGIYQLNPGKESFVNLESLLTKDSSLNKLLELGAKLKVGPSYLESSLSFKNDIKYLLMTLNLNAKDSKNYLFLLSVKTSSELFKELTLSSELKSIGLIYQAKCNLNLVSTKSYNIEVTQVRKVDLNNGLDWVSNVKWVSDVPYLNSGSYVFGVLVSKNGNSQINFSLLYKNAKKINVKFSIDNKFNEFQASAETFIITPIKISLSISRISKNTFTINSEFGYQEKYLKLSDTKISWSVDNIKSIDFSMTLLSSYEMFNDFSLVTNSYYENEKFFKTFKANMNSKYKGKAIQMYKIDLSTGEIKIDSKLGQYIKNWKIKNLQLDLKYKFNSIRDMSFKHKFLAEPIIEKTELEVIYFRKLKDEKPKTIEGMGEAMWFCKIDYNYKDTLFKKVAFIDKDMLKGVLELQVNIPKYSIKLDKISTNIEIQKESENVYKGTATYKTHQYQFKYESLGIRKKSLQIDALSKNTEPKAILISYDFQDNLLLKISADKILNLDVNMKSDSGKKSGKIEFFYKEKTILNLQVIAEIKLPSDVQTIADVFTGFIKFKKGMYIKSQISGKIFDFNVKRITEIYHSNSLQFPGGTKSFFSIDTEAEFTRPIIHKMSVSFDRNYPMFDYEGNIFLMIDKELKIDRVTKIKFISNNDFMVDTKSNVKNKLKWNFLVVYNPNTIQTSIGFELPENQFVFGFGFRKIKPNGDLSFHLVYSKNNYTVSTNLGNLLQVKGGDYFPIGKEYFIEISKKYEIRIARKKMLEFDIILNYDWSQPVNVKVMIQNKNGKNSVELKGSSPFEFMKDFKLFLEIEYPGKVYKFTASLRLNKKLISDLTLKYFISSQTKPHQLKVDYKGTNNIKGEIDLDTEKYKFGHSITVKDGNYKTEIWTSTSTCQLKPVIDCYMNYKNQVREIVSGLNWGTSLKRMELTWHKTKEQSLILTIQRKSNEKYILFENPINKIRLTYAQVTQHEERVGKLYLDIKSVGKSTNKDIFINLNYAINGSLKSDYKLELKAKTSLMHKEIRISVKRDVNLDIGDLYAVQVKASFDDEKTPFFKLKGYLRQLSTRSYEIKLHSTNYERFANLTITTIFASEEITLEYELVQSDLPPNKFLLQYIPFRKFHLTNKKDFKILINRVIYQYGYRSDCALKLGSKGIDIVGFSTFTRSPLKYYAELNNKDEKMVIHVRPVGNFIIGEMYRKTSDKKILDASLKVNVDNKNTLTSKLYWHPELFDRMKTFCETIFNPDNMKTLMAQAYQNSENQFSKYLSSVKTDVIKNMNVPISLEFMKGIANDWEKFPKSIALSYENDDYYIKTTLKKFTEYLTNLDIPVRFYRFQTSCSELKDVLFKTFYDWFIDAKLYSALYQPMKDNLNSFTYDHVKSGIKKMVNLGKSGFEILNVVVNKIGDVLDIISEKAKNSVNLSLNLKETVNYFYKNSIIMDILSILTDIRTEVLNVIEKIMNTDIVKQRIQYYQDAIQNSQDTINLLFTFKDKILMYLKSSNAVSNLLKTVELIRSMKYKDAFLNLIKLDEAKFQMNLDEATIEFQIYVPPISRTYLKLMKTFGNWFPSQAIYQMSKATLGEKLLELFYRYEYIMFNYGSLSFNSLKKLLPPFAKTAWVLRGTSIITFDDNAIKIGSGKCSYLLARDFKKSSFSIVMNIDPKTDSVEFELSYIKKITIFKDGIVKVDGKTVNILPIVFKENKRNVVIYRDDDLTKIKTSEGLVIKYFNNLNILKVMVTGYWQGSIRGLLGSNDFDKINDLSTPTGLITHDTGVLSKSWSLGKCDGKTKTGLHTIRIDQKQLQECVNLFQPDSISYLKRCYSLINPEPYFELCHRSLQYATKTKNEFQDMLCNLSRNYVIRCKAKGIMIRLDRNCVKCGKVKLGNKISTHELNKQSNFHYIFIMEQSKCILSYKVLIENLAKMMGFKSENIFTLLSFNGNDVFNEVHFKTIDNKIHTKGKDFMKLLSEFYSSDQISPGRLGGKTSQTGKAIYDVIKMSSVPSYIEKIILVTCSSCSEHQKYIYSLLAGLLNNAGISVTYLTDQTFTGDGANSNTVGLGNKLVYFFESDTIKKVPWKRNIQSPPDACSSLAPLKQGFVWSLKPLVSNMRMRRLAEVIHSELIKIKGSTPQSCYCTAGNYDDGKTECKIPKFYQFYSMLF